MFIISRSAGSAEYSSAPKSIWLTGETASAAAISGSMCVLTSTRAACQTLRR